MAENRNIILAIALSIIVLFGWQYFVARPHLERTAALQSAATPSPSPVPAPAGDAAAPTASATDGVTPPASGAASFATREAAVAADPRVPIDTPTLAGSVNLKGGRIDDLSLKDYRVSVDKTSPSVHLLSPLGGPEAYYAETGFVAPAGSDVRVPGADTVWTAPAGARLTPETPLTLTFDAGGGLVYTRTISVDAHSMFELKDEIANGGESAATVYPYGITIRYGHPVNKQATWILHEGVIGVFGEAGLHEVTYANLVTSGEEKPVESTKTGWLGITDKYWATALIPAGEGAFKPRFLHALVGQTDTYQADYLRDAVVVAPKATVATTTRLFAGPKEVRRIDAYESQFGIDRFDRLIDWGWFYWLTKPMFYLIDFLYRLVGNFGIAILAVTVIIKAVFFPLANKSYASMTKMKKFQPKMKELQERYADDKARLNQEMMNLYKEEKINPLSGCLPIVVQIPVFFSLYKVLYVTIEMRHAPFFGWIQDLSAPDPTSVFNLFGLLPWGVPAMLAIGVWPLVMGVTMFIQMKLNPAPPDPTQAMLFTWMPILFTFMLASFPAGLVIYWAWNNTLSILQQSAIMRRYGVKIELWDNIRSSFKLGKTAKPSG